MMSLYTWYKRIHFGKWTNRREWQASVEKVSRRWVTHLPLIPDGDNKKRNHNVKSWQYAGLLLGLDDSFSKRFLETHPNLFLTPSVDKALLLYVLYRKNQISKEILLDYAQKLIPDVEHTIPYRKNLPDIRFVDTIGMLIPFLFACGWESLALEQIEEYDNALLKGVFPPHAFDIKKGLPLGVYDWGRGLGWYILGITETDGLKGNDERIVRLAEEMLGLRRQDGGLGCFFFSPSHMESSATALLGLLFLKAFHLTQRQDFLSAAKEAERALMRMTRRDGAVDYGQGDTIGIGLYSLRFDILPFSQGMTLLLSKELDLIDE